jgi:hypothetical protein
MLAPQSHAIQTTGPSTPASSSLAAPAVVQIEGVQVGQQAHGRERSAARRRPRVVQAQLLTLDAQARPEAERETRRPVSGDSTFPKTPLLGNVQRRPAPTSLRLSPVGEAVQWP